MIVFAVGPTTDTAIPGATRCCAGTKSPLTGLFFDTTFGGMFAAAQKRSGFEAIAITGRAAEPVYLRVHEDGAEIKPAADLWGQYTQETNRTIRDPRRGQRRGLRHRAGGRKPRALRCAVHTWDKSRERALPGAAASAP